MIEIRSPQPDELDVLLAVMCEAFGLPFAPARDVFYRDPYYDVQNKRVLVEDGVPISCLTIVDSQMWIGKAIVRVAGIANVATRQSHQGKGYATRLLAATIPTLRERGFGFSALLLYSYGFYRRLGWELAGTQYKLTARPSALPFYREARYVRNAL